MPVREKGVATSLGCGADPRGEREGGEGGRSISGYSASQEVSKARGNLPTSGVPRLPRMGLPRPSAGAACGCGDHRVNGMTGGRASGETGEAREAPHPRGLCGPWSVFYVGRSLLWTHTSPLPVSLRRSPYPVTTQQQSHMLTATRISFSMKTMSDIFPT